MNVIFYIWRIARRISIWLRWRMCDQILPIFTVLELWWTNCYCQSRITRPTGVVVSLTSYGKRISTVYLTIESIVRGRVRPSRIILWLDESKAFHDLPASLRRLKDRGLEIKLCKDYGPYKKFYPYVESQSIFDTPLVTADDDMLYPAFWLEELLNTFAAFPETVNCHHARDIKLNEEGIARFSEWRPCRSAEPAFRHYVVGYSGAIYPPGFLRVLKKAGRGFEECCPWGDDVWLHVQALRSGYKIRQIRAQAPFFPIIPGTQAAALWKHNDQSGGNDAQIEATYAFDDIQILREEPALHRPQ